jgi:flagellar hook-associated protein 1 FlgK
MGDIGRVLNTTREAILSHLTALNVTGNNVANVNTPGYSRLRATFGSVGVIDASQEQGQFGVKITSIERLYDKYLEASMVRQEQEVGYNSAQLDVLNRVEGIFNESDGGGISELLSQFWGAWSELSANPTGITERDNLVSISQSLASMFSQKANELINVQSDTNTLISDTVTELNNDLDTMADLNNKIAQIEISGGNAASLRDERAELLQKISQIIDINYYEEADSSLNIFISNGRSLVEGINVWKLDVENNPVNSNYYDIVFEDTPTVAINDRLQGGKLAGLLDVRDKIYVWDASAGQYRGYLSDLNNMAAAIINSVNTQHSSGYDLDGNVGGSYFSTTSTLAKDMQVDSAIAADVRKIAASATVNRDGQNASLMNAIKDNSTLMAGGTATIDNYYQTLVARVGNDVASSQRGLDQQTYVLNQIESQWEAVSGVSIDEEMLNMIKYQAGYNAAARLIGTLNEMMDTLINLGE